MIVGRPVAVLVGLGAVAVARLGSSPPALAAAPGIVGAWGYNSNGQLGDGITTDHLTPTAIRPLGRDRDRSGQQPQLAAANGTVMAWGYNGDGQIGDATTTEPQAAAAVAGLRQPTTASSTRDP